jgi:hypothetical protein
MSDPNPPVDPPPPKVEQNGTDDPPPKPPSTPKHQERGENGQFKPKDDGQISPEQQTNESIKRYFDRREQELYESLKEVTSPKELEDFDQLTRIKMMELLIKKTPNTPPQKDVVNPLHSPPLIEKPLPTIMEQNLATKYRADMRREGGYLDKIKELRGLKK